MTTTLTSQLDAVNTMIRSIGETPINSLTEVTAADALIAMGVLTDVTREVQLKGWHFNREKNFPLHVTTDDQNNLLLPENILSITASDCESDRNLTVRGNRVYDLDEHTFSFPDTDSISFDIIWLFEFDMMPESLRRYVSIRATRKFQDDVVGDEAQHSYKSSDEVLARLLCDREERRNTPLNIFSNSSSQAILNRIPKVF